MQAVPMTSSLALTGSASRRGGTAIGISIAVINRTKVATARRSLAHRAKRTVAATASASPANGGATERRTALTDLMKWSLSLQFFLVSSFVCTVYCMS